MELFETKDFHTFKVDSLKDLEETAKVFNSCQQKVLLDYVTAVMRLFRKPCRVVVGKKELPVTDFFPAKKSYQYRKEDTVKACALIHCCPENLRLVLDLYGEKEREVVRLLVEKGAVSNRELKANGCTGMISLNFSWGSSMIDNSLLGLFYVVRSAGELDESERYYYYHEDLYLCLPFRLRPIYAKALFPERTEFSSWMSEQPGEGLEIVDSEKNFTSSFPILQGLSRNGSIIHNLFKMSAPAATKVIAATTIRDAVPDAMADYYKVSVGQYFLPALDFVLQDKKERNMQDTVKEASKYISYGYLENLAPPFLHHIKGFRRNKIKDTTRSDYGKCLLWALSQARDSWVELEALNFFLQNNPDSSYACGSTFDARFFSDCPLENTITGEAVYLSDQQKEIDLEMLRAIAFGLYGLGMLEIACDISSEPDSPCEHIIAVRLNGLGRYAVGMTNDYTAQSTDTAAYFELDSERLIIRSMQPGNPYESLLDEVATKIGGGRYLLNCESFLNGCATKDDVERKIKYFKDFICGDLPPVWTEFFNTVLKRCSPLRAAKEVKYRLLNLNPEDTDLVRLIKSNDRIRSMVIMAEGYRVLVPDSVYQSFCKLMKTYGYLI